ncbi:MAG: YadA-like family protein, partial [Synergistaceae bacterium]|nr:YadA-like family protein [Candidatus Equadaptatus faecalis]
ANSTAMGYGTTSSGNYSTSMGYGTTAEGEYSTSMGYGTTASGVASTAMGYNTNASGDDSTAMGQSTNASGVASTAMGCGTNASGDYSTAMGIETIANGGTSMAMGVGSNAVGESSFAGGGYYNLTDDTSTAGGSAYGRSSFAFGEGAVAGVAGDADTYAGVIALGNNAKAVHANSVALGNNAETKDKADISSATINGTTYTFGGGTTAEGVVSVGSGGHLKQIVNVANGAVTADSTDAITGAQLYVTNSNLIKSFATGTSGNITAEKVNGEVLEVAQMQDNAISGASLDGNTLKFTLKDRYTGTETPDAVNVDLSGLRTPVVLNGSMIKSFVNGKNTSIDLIPDTTEPDKVNVVIKTTDTAYFDKMTAGASFDAANRTDILPDGISIVKDSIADTAKLTSDTLRVGGKDYITPAGINANNQKITNTADGNIESGSKDAINGGQLYDYSKVKIIGSEETVLSENLNSGGGIEIAAGENIEFSTSGNKLTINATGGSGGYDAKAVHYDTDEDGNRLNSVTLKDTEDGTETAVTLHNVAAGTQDTDAVNLKQMKDAIGSGVGSRGVAYDDDTRETITLGNGTGTPAKITNLMAGEVSPTSTDAINGAQLYARDLAINANTQEIREVGAISAALAGLHFVEPSGENGDKLVGAVAYGGYRGANAEAIGLAYKPNPNMMLSASTSISNGNDSQNAYNVGFSLKFGKGETAVTRAALQKQVKYLNGEIETLKNDKAAQGELIKQLLERIEKLENK